MKSLITTVVCGCLVAVFAALGGANPRVDDKPPVIKAKKLQYIIPSPDWTGASGVALSPDGERVAVTAHGGYGPNGLFVVWDVATSKKLLEVNANAGEKRSGGLNCLAYSPDGKLIATGGVKAAESGRLTPVVVLWDAHTGKRLRSIEGHVPGGQVYSVVFSADGKRILSGGGGGSSSPRVGELVLWDTESGKKLLELQGHKGLVRCARISSDGKRIVSAATDATVRVWDAETGKELIKLKGHHHHWRFCAAISRDGKRIVTAGEEIPVRLWDVDTGKELHAFSKDPLNAVAFSPDGKWVVGAVNTGNSGTSSWVKMWDVATGREVVSFRAHEEGWPSGMDLSADGKRIATCFSGDGHVSVWSLQSAP